VAGQPFSSVATVPASHASRGRAVRFARAGRRRCQVAEFLGEEAGYVGGSRLVEGKHRRQPQPDEALKPVAQLDGDQGVKADVAEGHPRADRVDAGAERGRRLRPHQVEQDFLALGPGQPGEPLAQRRAAPGGLRRSAARFD